LAQRYAKLIHHLKINDIERRIRKSNTGDRLVMADQDPGRWIHVKILADSVFIPERSKGSPE
jgi:hypothetical protein